MSDLGNHKLIAGNARDGKTFGELMEGDRADAVFTDPPYNVKINGNVRGTGRTRHREFVAALGEMTRKEFDEFLRDTLTNMAAVSKQSHLFAWTRISTSL